MKFSAETTFVGAAFVATLKIMAGFPFTYFSYTRWTPRDAQVDWALILDRASATWLIGRIATGEKKDGRDDLYFPIAKKFLNDPSSVPAGTRDSIGRVNTPSGSFVIVFERAFFFHDDGRVWRIDLDRECASGKKFNGTSCV